MLPSITPQEVVLILVLALLLFGPKKLPELARGLGEGIREFRRSVSGEEKLAAPTATPPPVAPVAPVAPAAPHAVESQDKTIH